MIYSFDALTNPLIRQRKINTMEKRKFTRFRAQDDAFAALRGNSTKVGKIKDISLNGLAFRYLAEEMPKEAFTRVEIFLTGNGFHLSGVPCTMVYDEKKSTSTSLAMSTYRCGLKFGPLEAGQKDKLEFFLNNHTIGEV